jgi:hypothetical protein
MKMNAMNFNAPVVTNVPRLTSSARLVELSISVWTGRKQDKAATAQTAAANGANKNHINTTKALLGDCAELDAVKKFAGNTRQWVYGGTMGWGDLGQRLLPMPKFADFHKEATALRTEFYELVEKFLSAYDFAQSKAQAQLGALYNPDEYPSAESLRDKFRFNLAYPPLPDVGIVQDIQDEAERYLAEEYSRVYSERIEGTMKEVWQRVYDALKHMSDKLDFGGEGSSGEKKRIHESTISNLRDLCKMLPDFNITNDSRLSSLHAELDQALMGVTTDALREDAGYRKDTKKAMDDILKNMAW